MTKLIKVLLKKIEEHNLVTKYHQQPRTFAAMNVHVYRAANIF